eukprot:766378-Hanusia_phi.AAC.4
MKEQRKGGKGMETEAVRGNEERGEYGYEKKVEMGKNNEKGQEQRGAGQGGRATADGQGSARSGEARAGLGGETRRRRRGRGGFLRIATVGCRESLGRWGGQPGESQIIEPGVAGSLCNAIRRAWEEGVGLVEGVVRRIEKGVGNSERLENECLKRPVVRCMSGRVMVDYVVKGVDNDG